MKLSLGPVVDTLEEGRPEAAGERDVRRRVLSPLEQPGHGGQELWPRLTVASIFCSRLGSVMFPTVLGPGTRSGPGEGAVLGLVRFLVVRLG